MLIISKKWEGLSMVSLDSHSDHWSANVPLGWDVASGSSQPYRARLTNSHSLLGTWVWNQSLGQVPLLADGRTESQVHVALESGPDP